MAKNSSNFWRECFEEYGRGSSKRVVGAFMIIAAVICVLYLVFRYGETSMNQGLIETIIFVGAGLLGLSSVTSIWKGGKTPSMTSNEKKEKTEDQTKMED